jgi:hypothetical protein
VGALTTEVTKMRAIVIGAALTLLVGATAFAGGSKCDQGVVKAVGKAVSCECNANAKASKSATTPDYTKCQEKFGSKCGKAKGAADCIQQTDTCGDIFNQVGPFVSANCEASPSGAFLE